MIIANRRVTQVNNLIAQIGPQIGTYLQEPLPLKNVEWMVTGVYESARVIQSKQYNVDTKCPTAEE